MSRSSAFTFSRDVLLQALFLNCVECLYISIHWRIFLNCGLKALCLSPRLGEDCPSSPAAHSEVLWPAEPAPLWVPVEMADWQHHKRLTESASSFKKDPQVNSMHIKIREVQFWITLIKEDRQYNDQGSNLGCDTTIHMTQGKSLSFSTASSVKLKY